MSHFALAHPARRGSSFKSNDNKKNKTKKGRGGCGGTLITSARHPVGVFLLYTVCGYSTMWLASWGCLLWYVQQAEADCVPASHPPGLTQPLTCMIKGNREGGGGQRGVVVVVGGITASPVRFLRQTATNAGWIGKHPKHRLIVWAEPPHARLGPPLRQSFCSWRGATVCLVLKTSGRLCQDPTMPSLRQRRPGC